MEEITNAKKRSQKHPLQRQTEPSSITVKMRREIHHSIVRDRA